MTLLFASGLAGSALAARPVAAQEPSADKAEVQVHHLSRADDRTVRHIPGWAVDGQLGRVHAPRPGWTYQNDMMCELLAVPSARFDPEATCVSFR